MPHSAVVIPGESALALRTREKDGDESAHSLAYTVSSLLNRSADCIPALFGKGKEPFWQQAYTNLVRWIIELHRVFPERWVTLQQGLPLSAIDPELFAAKIDPGRRRS